MKKLLLFFVFTILAFTANAKDVTFEQARQKALDFMGVKNVDCISYKQQAPTKNKDQATPSYYIFNKTKENGFVIISGEDRMPDVFGYSDDENFSSDNNMPPALVNLLNLYSEYVEAVRADDAVVETSQNRVPSSAIEVLPLLNSKWGQDQPYNLLCPEGTVTGCVATAVAQIMMYHKWPESGKGYVSTIYDSKSLGVDLSKSAYNWNVMKNTTEENLADETAAEAVAKLIYDCGVALKMNYGTVSGAYTHDAVKVFNNNFNYKGSTLRFMNRECFSTDEWMNIVKTELLSERPVYYAGSSPMGGGKDAAGHAFVIDGCNSNDFVHVNWGWDGYANGYFDIALLNPDMYSFSQNQLMISGIMPDVTGEDIAFVPHIIMGGEIKTDTEYVLYKKTGSPEFNVVIPSLANPNPETLAGVVTVRLYNEQGQIVKNDIKSSKMFTIVYNLPTGYYLTSDANPIVCKFPSGLDDGIYYMKVITKYNDQKDWIMPDVTGGQQNNYIRAVIANGKVTFDKEPVTTAINGIKTSVNTSSSNIYTLYGRNAPKGYHGIVVKRGKKIVQ